MSATRVLSATTALLLSAAPLMAGGLPRVCLPIDGVTADNAAACIKLVGGAFGTRAERVEVREDGKQWYVLFSLNAGELNPADLDAAVKGSPFSVPRSNLRLIGEVVLEVTIDEAHAPVLLSDLKGVKHFTVEGSKRENGALLVTAVTLYPPHTGAQTEDFGKKPVEKELFGVERSDFAPKADPPATARDLPSYDGLRAVIEKNGGSLKGVRWKLLGCHVQGAVVVLANDEKRK